MFSIDRELGSSTSGNEMDKFQDPRPLLQIQKQHIEFGHTQGLEYRCWKETLKYHNTKDWWYISYRSFRPAKFAIFSGYIFTGKGAHPIVYKSQGIPYRVNSMGEVLLPSFWGLKTFRKFKQCWNQQISFRSAKKFSRHIGYRIRRKTYAGLSRYISHDILGSALCEVGVYELLTRRRRKSKWRGPSTVLESPNRGREPIYMHTNSVTGSKECFSSSFGDHVSLGSIAASLVMGCPARLWLSSGYGYRLWMAETAIGASRSLPGC